MLIQLIISVVIYDVFNQTSFQTSIHKFSFDFQSDTWEVFNPIVNQKYSSDFGQDFTLTAIQSTDLNATFAYIKSRFAIIYFSHVQLKYNNS